jgi:hypothetical protein
MRKKRSRLPGASISFPHSLLIFTGYMPILANWLVYAVPIFARLG